VSSTAIRLDLRSSRRIQPRHHGRRARRLPRLLVAAGAAGLVLLSGGSPAALADTPVGATPLDAQAASVQPHLTRHSGPIQSRPRVHLVFWGESWRDAKGPRGQRAEIEATFAGLGGSSFIDVLHQYGVDGYAFGGSWIDRATPPNNPSISRVGAEAEHAAEVNGWRNDGNSQVLVFVERGTYTRWNTKTSGCAGHTYQEWSAGSRHWTVHFSVLPHPADVAACRYWNGLAAGSILSVRASHEFAETATDPRQNTAWYGRTGEVADWCTNAAGGGPARIGSGWVQRIWDQRHHRCAA
jgi:hypothetical protein